MLIAVSHENNHLTNHHENNLNERPAIEREHITKAASVWKECYIIFSFGGLSKTAYCVFHSLIADKLVQTMSTFSAYDTVNSLDLTTIKYKQFNSSFL